METLALSTLPGMAPLKANSVVKLLFYREFLDQTQSISLLIGVDEDAQAEKGKPRTRDESAFSCYFVQIKVDQALLNHIKDPNFTKVA